MSTLRFEPLGDSAVLFRVPRSPDAYARAQGLTDAVARAALPGVHDVSAAYDAFAVYFDAAVAEGDDIARRVLQIAETTPTVDSRSSELVKLPVRYDGADLDFVAATTGLTREQVIELHGGTEYTAHAVGFVPGFAYLGDLHQQLRLPRRSTPRGRVPPGSVAIAGRHTAVYPFATSGGWHILGTTTERLFDVLRVPPALITVGTRVRFEAV